MNVTIPNKKYCVWRIKVWGPLEELKEIPENLDEIKECMYTISVYKTFGTYQLWCHRDCKAMYLLSGDFFLDFFETEKKCLLEARKSWKKACRGALKLKGS
jgi:hypothetical protein